MLNQPWGENLLGKFGFYPVNSEKTVFLPVHLQFSPKIVAESFFNPNFIYWFFENRWHYVSENAFQPVRVSYLLSEKKNWKFSFCARLFDYKKHQIERIFEEKQIEPVDKREPIKFVEEKSRPVFFSKEKPKEKEKKIQMVFEPSRIRELQNQLRERDQNRLWLELGERLTQSEGARPVWRILVNRGLASMSDWICAMPSSSLEHQFLGVFDNPHLSDEFVKQEMRRLQNFQEQLPCEFVWRTAKRLAEIQSDDLFLARIRDQLVLRIYERGLAWDWDLPGFLLQKKADQVADSSQSSLFQTNFEHLRSWLGRLESTDSRSYLYHPEILAFIEAFVQDQQGNPEKKNEFLRVYPLETDKSFLYCLRARFRDRLENPQGEFISDEIYRHRYQKLTKQENGLIRRFCYDSRILSPKRMVYIPFGNAQLDAIFQSEPVSPAMFDRLFAKTENDFQRMAAIHRVLAEGLRVGEHYLQLKMPEVLDRLTNMANENVQISYFSYLIYDFFQNSCYYSLEPYFEKILQLMRKVFIKNANYESQSFSFCLPIAASACEKSGFSGRFREFAEELSGHLKGRLIGHYQVMAMLAGYWDGIGKVKESEEIFERIFRGLRFFKVAEEDTERAYAKLSAIMMESLSLAKPATAEQIAARFFQELRPAVDARQDWRGYYSLWNLATVDAFAQLYLKKRFLWSEASERFYEREVSEFRRLMELKNAKQSWPSSVEVRGNLE